MSNGTAQPSTPEVLVDLILSLDGHASADRWPGWWGKEGPEYLRWLEEQPEAAWTAAMGARTYTMFAQFAKQIADSSMPANEDEQASIGGIAALDKVVFSSTLSEPLAMPNTRLVAGDAVEAVAEMRRTGSENLRTMGSLSLCRSLVTAGLVDRIRLVIFPVITGATGSEPIFNGYPDVSLEMIGSRTFDGRTQMLEYVPTVLDGPPLPA